MDKRKRPASTRLKFGKAKGAEEVTNWNTGVEARRQRPTGREEGKREVSDSTQNDELRRAERIGKSSGKDVRREAER